MEESSNTSLNQELLEGIDLKKLRNIIHNNWGWILLLILFTNISAYLTIRYTKPLFESSSELKLDSKENASELGFRDFLPEQQKVNVISGEIETIQSKSFLNQVIDSLNLHVSYYSIGKFLNTELYTSSPFRVKFALHESAHYNKPFTCRFGPTLTLVLTWGSWTGTPSLSV